MNKQEIWQRWAQTAAQTAMSVGRFAKVRPFAEIPYIEIQFKVPCREDYLVELFSMINPFYSEVAIEGLKDEEPRAVLVMVSAYQCPEDNPITDPAVQEMLKKRFAEEFK